MPLRARAVPGGSAQAESIHFPRTRLGWVVRKSVRLREVVSCCLLVITGLLGSCHRVCLDYTVVAAAAVFKWVNLSRARPCFLTRVHVTSKFLTLYSSAEKKSVYGQCSSSCSMKRNESLNSLCTTSFSDFHTMRNSSQGARIF